MSTMEQTNEPVREMDDVIAEMAERLVAVPGIHAVALGGSRARGTHTPESDWDLGLYYRGEVDTAVLAALAEEFAGKPVEVNGPGSWGPWVNGGAWLFVDGVQVDWLLRDLDRVERVWADCEAGRFEVGTQAGHPLGFWSPAYPGEVALCRVLADPSGGLTALRAKTERYPRELRRALADAAWEADFLVDMARKSAKRGDALHVSLCLSRAYGVLAQSLHAHHGTWCLNEKGALPAAAKLPDTPRDFAARVTSTLRALDAEALDEASRLVADVRAVLKGA